VVTVADTGPPVNDVSGAVLSGTVAFTVQDRVAGVGSAVPVEPIAVTSTVCGPTDRPE
jgi:hypothetical protein